MSTTRRKKKAFIDRKEANVYQLVWRSQLDPLTGTSDESSRVLRQIGSAKNDTYRGEPRQLYGADDVDSGSDDDELFGESVDQVSQERIGSNDQFNDHDDQNEELWQYERKDFELGDLRLPSDGYDYAKHLRAPGNGTFIPAVAVDEAQTKKNQRKAREVKVLDVPEGYSVLKKREETPLDMATYEPQLPREVFESDSVVRIPMLDRAAPGMDEYEESFMPDDVVAALHGDLPDEALEDDFVVLAGGAASDSDYTQSEDDDFYGDADSYDSDDLADLPPLDVLMEQPDVDSYALGHSKRDIDANAQSGGVAMTEERKLLEDRFAALVEREYDDADIGDLDEHHIDGNVYPTFDMPSIREFVDRNKERKREGERTVALLNLDVEFQAPSNDNDNGNDNNEAGARMQAIEAKGKGKGKGRASSPPRRRNVDDQAPVRLSQVTLRLLERQAEEERLKRQKKKRDGGDADNDDHEIDELYDRVSVRGKPQWDCESILSTYSNTENHPTLIAEPIRLSSRTGMPIGVLREHREQQKREQHGNDGRSSSGDDDDDDDQDDFDDDDDLDIVPVDLGAPRPKNETREEKRQRKQAVKAMRRERRQQKKALKGTFRQEENRQKRERVKAPLNQKTVFRL